MHLNTKGNFKGEFLESQEGTPDWTVTFLPQHVEESFLPTKGAHLQPSDTTINSAGRGSVRRGGVKSQAAEVRRVHAVMFAVRLLEESPSCLMEVEMEMETLL